MLINQSLPIMMAASVVMGADIDREWFEVMCGDDSQMAKAEYDRYKLRKSSRKAFSRES